MKESTKYTSVVIIPQLSVAIPKEQWKGAIIPLITRSDSNYDLELSPLCCEGCTVSIIRKSAEKEIVHTLENIISPIIYIRINVRVQKPIKN